MQHITTALKGITSDIDNVYVSSDNWVFPTHGIRVFNRSGQGYIITSQKGTEKEFSVNDGYVIIAAEEHKGIIYLISVKDDITQIGTYPSPKSWYDNNGDQVPINSVEGFSDVYGTLRNYSTRPDNTMETKLFGYTRSSNVKLIIDDSFDESVNLYICDGVGEDKVVNSGFIYTGELNAFPYSEQDFKGKMNHVLYSIKPPITDKIEVVQGGVLKPGQYHFYYAYKTLTFDATEYITGTYGVHVGEGSTLTDSAGVTNVNATGDQRHTDKKILIHLTGLDTSYSYISIGILRMYESETNQLLTEEFAIAKDFPIVNGEAEIDYSGREDVSIFDTGELYLRYLQERISVDQTFFNARMWKTHLKRDEFDREVFVDLALMTNCKTVLGEKLPLYQYRYIASGDQARQLYYQNANNISNKLGYFGGEVYPFTIVFMMDDGTTTAGYPIMGNDEGSHNTGVTANKKGLVWVKRMVDVMADNPGVTDPLRYTINLEFDTTDMVNEMRSNPLYSRVVGFYIARGERIQNQLYDGYFTQTAKGIYFMKDREHQDSGFSNTSSCLSKTRGKVNYRNPTNVWFGEGTSEGDALHFPVFKDLWTVRKGPYTTNFDKDGPNERILTYGEKKWRNLYYFPIAVTNDNFPTTKFNLIQDKPDEYEYVRAYSYPWAKFKTWLTNSIWEKPGRKKPVADPTTPGTGIYGDNQWYAPNPGDGTSIQGKPNQFSDEHSDASTIFHDALDPMLRLSYDHFAMISPDFAMEQEHTFSSGEELYVMFYTKDRANDVWQQAVGETHFTTDVYNAVELIPEGGASNIHTAYPGVYKDCGNTYDIQAQDWVAGYSYMAKVTSQPTYIILGGDNVDSFLVRHIGEFYVCIQHTHKGDIAGDDTTPGAPGSKYWKKILSPIHIYGSERGPYQFPGATLNHLYNAYINPGCTSGTYPIPPEFLPDPTDTEANWENTTFYEGIKSTQIPVEYLKDEVGTNIHGYYKNYSQTRDVFFDPATPVVKKMKCYAIDKGTHSGQGNFASYAEDGYNYKGLGKRGLFYTEGTFHMATTGTLLGIGAESKMSMAHYNRSYQTPAYIGLIPADKTDTFFTDITEDQEWMVKVFRHNPETDVFFDDVLKKFNTQYTQYWNVTNFLPKDIHDTVFNVYKGDNYKSQNWLRMTHHLDFDPNTKKKLTGFHSWGRNDTNSIPVQYPCMLRSSMFSEWNYMHGYLHGLMTDNRHNVNFRADIKTLETDGGDITYSYFPKIASSVDPSTWIHSSSSNQDLVESMYIPAGNDANYGYVKIYGYDATLPKDSANKKTRIAFSETKIAESFQDGYRVMRINNFRDFSTNYGAIMRIDSMNNQLFSIRERAIMSHVVGQTDLKSDGESVTLAPVSIYLSAQENPLAYYGIQNWHALNKTKYFLYGVDMLNKIPWRVGMDYADQGSRHPRFSDMATEFATVSYFDELLEDMYPLTGTPMNGNGIAIGYNEGFKEVYFSFIEDGKYTTVVFDERIRAFKGTTPLHGSLYISKGNHVLTTLYDTSDVNLADVTQDKITFYGNEVENIFSFIVNGAKEKESYALVEKIFESIRINSPDIALRSIQYETDRQQGAWKFKEGEDVYDGAQYIENDWNIPIIRDTKPGSDIYEEGSEYRGRWMKVTVRYTGNPEFFIRSIVTKFKTSFA